MAAVAFLGFNYVPFRTMEPHITLLAGGGSVLRVYKS